MAHPHILTVKLQPRRIGYACESCVKAGKSHGTATHWLVCPDGGAIQPTCYNHGARVIAEYRDKLKPPEDWTLHPIHHHHDDRVTRPRGPICGHSHCVQNFIDTGNNACVPRMDA